MRRSASILLRASGNSRQGTRSRCWLLAAVAAAVTGCAADLRHEQLTIATISSSNLFGGEALFSGTLIARDGCLVANANEGYATPIFDPGVILSQSGKAIKDVWEGVEIPIGRSFRAGTAWLRDGGQGWSVGDIERFYGTRIPASCPTDNVIRLHDFELTERGKTMNGLEGNGR